ncbi:NIPSNAP family protein [Vibrio sp. vnigr-6D03]|uniref:NIPSNAP family protein n=1 Tax=Vibrio sp. vnigr-6D03 TaxID=2058088 RepID=UPI001F23FA06|nr:NIPSNAP family protein [Vibrio sp. vnigr-6D03]
MGQKISSPWASLLGFHATLPILDLEPQNLQIGALPENQAILAEPSALRWFEYNYCAYGLISFPSLTEYEVYRKRLKESESGQSNFSFAKDQRFIIEEKRTFLKVVSSTYKQAPRFLESIV